MMWSFWNNSTTGSFPGLRLMQVTLPTRGSRSAPIVDLGKLIVGGMRLRSLDGIPGINAKRVDPGIEGPK